MTIYTVGHSTRTADEFLDLLEHHGIKQLVDVRAIPASRRHPHFERHALDKSLERRNIDYVWQPALGGRRHMKGPSLHTAWRSDSFRAYADYMETPQFHHAIAQLLALAKRQRTTVMCAEAVFWRCHRQLIADALLICGVDVLHIVDEKKPTPHHLPEFARVAGLNIIYDGGETLPLF
jgi:uncharacterized protein (DUF488 family)